MSNVLKISDAASLALHTTVLLADRLSRPGTRERPLKTRQIASMFKVSEHHLSKVMQRLARAGLVLSERGPKGGFHLSKGGDRMTLLEVYEAIEGPLSSTDCLLGARVCGGKTCILGDLVCKLNAQVREQFARTHLNDATAAFQKLVRG